MTGRGLVWAVLFVCLLVAFGISARFRHLTAQSKAAALASGDKNYQTLAEEYRRLSDIAVTSQEHTELKLSEVNIQIEQLREQLAAVQHILKEVD